MGERKRHPTAERDPRLERRRPMDDELEAESRINRLETTREGKPPTAVERRTPLADRTLQKDRRCSTGFAVAVQLQYRESGAGTSINSAARSSALL